MLECRISLQLLGESYGFYRGAGQPAPLFILGSGKMQSNLSA